MSLVSSKTTVKMYPRELDGVKQRAFKRMIPMAYDIANANRRHAPVLTGALKNSIRVSITKPNEEIEVIAGGGRVPYALRRNFENYKHPQTLHYMENGVADVCSGNWVSKYFWSL